MAPRHATADGGLSRPSSAPKRNHHASRAGIEQVGAYLVCAWCASEGFLYLSLLTLYIRYILYVGGGNVGGI